MATSKLFVSHVVEEAELAKILKAHLTRDFRVLLRSSYYRTWKALQLVLTG